MKIRVLVLIFLALSLTGCTTKSSENSLFITSDDIKTYYSNYKWDGIEQDSSPIDEWGKLDIPTIVNNTVLRYSGIYKDEPFSIALLQLDSEEDAKELSSLFVIEKSINSLVMTSLFSEPEDLMIGYTEDGTILSSFHIKNYVCTCIFEVNDNRDMTLIEVTSFQISSLQYKKLVSLLE